MTQNYCILLSIHSPIIQATEMKNKTDCRKHDINTSLMTLHLNKRKSQTFSVFRYITIISSDDFCIAQYRRTLKDVHNNENMIN